MKEYVIIGNGTAATGCIEGIRSIDTESNITIVSAERHPVYCRDREEHTSELQSQR